MLLIPNVEHHYTSMASSNVEELLRQLAEERERAFQERERADRERERANRAEAQ